MTWFLSRLMGWAETFSVAENIGNGKVGALRQKFIDAKYSGEALTTICKQYEWVAKVFQPISIVLYVIMGIVGAAGAIYAIYLGIQLARAEDQSKRDDAKKHLITVLIAIAVTVALILFFNEIMPLIVDSFIDIPEYKAPTT